MRDPASERSVAAYAAALASGAPAPGGGAAAATVATFAAALAEKVCQLSFRRPGHAAAEPRLRSIQSQAAALRERCLALARDDEDAYTGYVSATRLAKATAEENVARRAALQAALVRSAEVPLAVANACLALFPLLDQAATLGNPHAVSDAHAGARLADAALHASLVMVRTNAASLADRERGGWFEERADEAEREAAVGLARVLGS